MTRQERKEVKITHKKHRFIHFCTEMNKFRQQVYVICLEVNLLIRWELLPVLLPLVYLLP